jgi:agmatinase
MDKKKLDALRRTYSGAKGGGTFDPEFAAVAAQAFITPDRRKWPFADPAAFLGAPYRPDALSLPDCGGIGVALIGVPMDLGVTKRTGARPVRERCARSSASAPASTRCESRPACT